MIKWNRERIRVPNKDYKKYEELTEFDFSLIDADRKNTGLNIWDDEYYYNYILNQNYDLV